MKSLFLLIKQQQQNMGLSCMYDHFRKYLKYFLELTTNIQGNLWEHVGPIW